MIIKNWTNYHSHTNFCDGSSSPEEYILQALQFDMLAYGFSSHAPVPFESKWCMTKENLNSYISTIGALKDKYKNDIQIYCGLEVDYIPGIAGPKSDFISNLSLDYTVGSIHFVDQFDDGRPWGIDDTMEIFESGLELIFKNDIRQALSRYFELTRKMVSEETPDIVGHLDKIKMHNTGKHFFSETADWYRKEVLKTLEVIKDTGTIVEVNTRGLYKGRSSDLYPSTWILKEIKKMDIPITLSSDAHQVEEIILGFPEAIKALLQIGFKSKMILNNGEWKKAKFED